MITYTIKEYFTHHYFAKRIFLFIFCNDHVVLVSHRLLMHAEFNQFNLSLIDNLWLSHLTPGSDKCSVVGVEGTSQQIWPKLLE